MLHSAAKTYYRTLRRAMPGSRAEKDKYIRFLSKNVEAYCTENPQATAGDLCQHFGSVEDITESFMSMYIDADFIPQQRKRKWILRLIAAVVVITAIVVISATAVTYVKHKEMREGRIVITITEDEVIGEDTPPIEVH